MTIVEFLIARLDEEESIAKRAASGPWEIVDRGWTAKITGGEHGEITVAAWQEVDRPSSGGDFLSDEPDLQHITTHDPVRVLRDIAAKRRLIALAEWHEDRQPMTIGEQPILIDLASIYSHHPDYQQEWRLE